MRLPGASLIVVCLLAAVCRPAAGAGKPFTRAAERIILAEAPEQEGTWLELFMAGEELYVLNHRAETIQVVPAAGGPARTINISFAGRDANTVFFCVRDGRFYLKPDNNNQIMEYDRQGRLIRTVDLTYGDEVFSMGAFAADGRGYLYAVNIGAGTVDVFCPDGSFQGTMARIGPRPQDLNAPPTRIYIDGKGDIYIAMGAPSASGSIARFSYQGRFLNSFRPEGGAGYGSNGFYPTSLCVDRLGNVYVFDRGASAVVKFDRRGREVARYPSAVTAGLAVGADGLVYLGGARNGFLDVLMPSDAMILADLGNEAYSDQDWAEAERYFSAALARDNQNTVNRLMLGETYYQQQKWLPAMREFAALNEEYRYSQAVTSFRRSIVANYWPLLILGLAVLGGLGWLAGKVLSRQRGRSSFLKVLWSPHHAMQREIARADPIKAWAIVAAFCFLNYVSWYLTNPVFAPGSRHWSCIALGRQSLNTMILVALWSWTAYKVGELFGGMSKRIGEILAGTALALMPLLIGRPLLAAASRLMTFDEVWLYTWADRLLIAWTVCLFLMVVMLAEHYDWRRAVWVGAVDAAVSGLVVFFGQFVLSVNRELYGFVREIVMDIYYRLLL